jgi:hypothetical protein
MNIVKGRPDFEDHNFGKTKAKKHPKYVYGSNYGCLIHEISYVEFQWYEFKMGHCVRLDSPKITASTRCGMFFFVSNCRSRGKAKVCEIPKEDAILCKACQKQGRNFPKNKEWEVSKQDAKTRLGCENSIKI